MAHDPLRRWLDRLDCRWAAQSDTDLLRRHVLGDDDTAFTELVRRYGPLVWAICRRGLLGEQDAEDAFQATFLALARQAATIRSAAALPAWLSEVAHRIAAASRRRVRASVEMPDALDPAGTDPATALASAEMCEAIQAELHRLPLKYRAPLLLCGIQGLTKGEAARRLGWPEGTVSGRLARARLLLAARLCRRGLAATLPVAAATVVPAGLHARTLEVVVTGSPSPVVRELLRLGGLNVMLSGRMKLITAVGLLVGGGLLVATLGYFFAAPPPRPADPDPAPAPPAVAAAESPAWRERLRLRGFADAPVGTFTPGGRIWLTRSNAPGEALRVWDTVNWTERWHATAETFLGTSGWLAAAELAPDGRTVAVDPRPTKPAPGRSAHDVVLCDVVTGREIARVPGYWPHFSPAGKLLAIWDREAVVLWDHTARRELARLDAGPINEWVRATAFSPDGSTLVTLSASGRSKLWDTASGKLRADLRGLSPVFSPDSRVLATELPGPALMLWDTATGAERTTLQGFTTPGVDCVFSPDGRYLVTGGRELGFKADGSYDHSNMEPIKLPDGSTRYTIKYPNTPQPLEARVWSVETGRELVRLPGKYRGSCLPLFTPDGRGVVFRRVGEGQTVEVAIWDMAAGRERVTLRRSGGLELGPFTPDGRSVALQALGGFRLFDLTDGADQGELPVAGGMASITFSPDGQGYVAFGFAGTAGEGNRWDVCVYERRPGSSLAEVLDASTARPWAPTPEQAATQQLANLKQEFATEMRKVAERAGGEQLSFDHPRARVWFGIQANHTRRALALADARPTSPVSRDALVFALNLTSGGPSDELRDLGVEALERVERHWLAADDVSPLLDAVRHHHSERSEALLEQFSQRSPHRSVRGQAMYLLAEALAGRARAARSKPDPANPLPPSLVAWLQATDPVAAEERATTLYALVRRDYADVAPAAGNKRNLGELAERAVAAMRELAVGEFAPEIQGKDLEGRPMRLSDFRGRVVLLVFSGQWCAPCRKLHAVKQALLSRFNDKPLEVLEVSTDADTSAWRDEMRAKGYGWRCWQDGGTDGPITSRWHVTSFPTVYLLDPKGVIRHIDLRGEEELIAAAEALLPKG